MVETCSTSYVYIKQVRHIPISIEDISKLFVVCTLKDTWNLGRQMSHLSDQRKLDSFFNPSLLRSKTSTTSESSIDE
jgi:hypothetical protein